MHSTPISWPAVIKYSGEAELLFVEDLHQWESDDDLYKYNYDDFDRLVDSEGMQFLLVSKSSGIVHPEPTGTMCELHTFNEWIQQHLSALDNCCVSKIAIQDFRTGVMLAQPQQ